MIIQVGSPSSRDSQQKISTSHSDKPQVSQNYFDGNGAPFHSSASSSNVVRTSNVPLVNDRELKNFVEQNLLSHLKLMFPKIYEKNAQPEKIIFTGGLSLRCDLIESFFKLVIQLSDKYVAEKIKSIALMHSEGKISKQEWKHLTAKFYSPKYKNELISKIMPLVKEKNQSHIILISPHEWLAGIHDEHLGHKWGQTPYQLPAFFQQYMTHLKSPNEYEELSEFRHMKKFYADTYSMCESLGLQAEIRKISSNGITEDGQISFTSGEPLRLQTENFVVFSSIRNERLAQNEKIKVFNSQGEELHDQYVTAQAEPHAKLLYSQSADAFPGTLLTAGASVSGIWLSLYLPEKNIITIVQKAKKEADRRPASYQPTPLLKDKLEARLHPDILQLPQGKEPPWLKLVWEGSLKKVIFDDGHVKVTGLDASFVDDVPVVLFEGSEEDFHKIFSKKYSAAGIETFAAFSSLKESQYIQASDIKKEQDGFMSTKNTPPGSLGSLILYNQLALGQFDILELFRMTNHAWLKEFNSKMLQEGIFLPAGFLDKIREVFSDAMFDYSPKMQMEIHELIYKNYCSMEAFPQDMDEQWQKYQSVLMEAYKVEVSAFECVSSAIQASWINE